MDIEYHLGSYQKPVNQNLSQLGEARAITRLWEGDHTLWDPDPEEITNRLGWLDIARRMEGYVPGLMAFVEHLQEEGYDQALLMGMGGSSLAPDLFSLIFGKPSSPLALDVLDSTDPAAVLEQQHRLDPQRTIFLVATKSGSTVETLSFFKHFYNWTADQLGEQEAGKHFIGITDPDSKLVPLGYRLGFREMFLNDPEIGGRYSALSYFGLLPAALVGVDLTRLLHSAREMMSDCRPETPLEQNAGAVLGNILGTLALQGRDKATFVTSEKLQPYPAWVEQLLAESTGKAGKGILPVVGEPLGAPGVYRDDRVFIHLTLPGENPPDGLRNLRKAGHPVIRMTLSDIYQLGGMFFLWEFATALAGIHLEINPFNQPNVESAKARAREMVSRYQEQGSLPEGQPSPLKSQSLDEFITSHIRQDSYLALQAFLPPSAGIEAALQQLRVKLRDKYHLPTTLGFGPRFLHSTGQLHKGDAGHGLFLQFTSRAKQDLPIPQEAGKPASRISFDTLKRAQALGDARALRDAGRNILSFSLEQNPREKLERFVRSY